ncbi:MAG: hypothetical protein R3F59_22075 [Myxococcota bacterium]
MLQLLVDERRERGLRLRQREEVLRVHPTEQPAARQPLVEHAAEREHVGARVRRQVHVEPLGREVRQAPHHDVALRVGRAREDLGDGDAEVEQLDVAVTANADVRRLHVAVDDAGVVGELQRRQHAHQHPHGHARRQRALGEALDHRAAGHELHHEVDGIAVGPGLVQRDHVRVLQAGHHLGLLQQPAPDLVVGRELRRDELHGPEGLAVLVEGPVDRGGAPGADRFEQAVPTGDHVAVGRRERCHVHGYHRARRRVRLSGTARSWGSRWRRR